MRRILNYARHPLRRVCPQHPFGKPDRFDQSGGLNPMSPSTQIRIPAVETEFVDIPDTRLKVSRVALGTWAMGGWMWGGTDQRESIATIHAALDQGINLIDTAPMYGSGVSEEIVGTALEGIRTQVVIATKVGLESRDGKIYRNATRGRIM